MNHEIRPDLKWKMENPCSCTCSCLLLPFFRRSFADGSRISYTSGLPIAPGRHLSLVALSGARLAAFFEGGVYVRPC